MASRQGDAQDALVAAGFGVLRSRVIWTSAASTAVVVALSNLLDTPWYPIRRHPEVGVLMPVLLALEALWALRQGARLGDVGIMLAGMSWPVMIAVSFLRMQQPGSPLAAEWTALGSGILVALLVRRRRTAGLMLLVVAACMTAVIVNRLRGTGLAPITVVIEVTVTATVTTAFRAVRDVAVRALAAVSLNEVCDPLTGLANRRGLERFGVPLWEESARAGHPLAVIIMDIDHFKRINDTQGHAAGDVVIREVADVLARQTRARDVAARLGGEEFLLVAAVPAGRALAVAERLRRSVEERLGSVTVSVGVHEVTPDVADVVPSALWTAVAVADTALYAAKRDGRNRCAVSGGGTDPQVRAEDRRVHRG